MCFPWPPQIQACTTNLKSGGTYPFSNQFHLKIQTQPLLETAHGVLKPEINLPPVESRHTHWFRKINLQYRHTREFPRASSESIHTNLAAIT